MATVGRDIESVELTERELWLDGPPLETFAEMRGRCPIHWTESFEEFPDEDGFWSVTTADDIHAVSRDWKTYSSERGGVLAAGGGFPLELAQAMFIGMDPPKHDRVKALFQKGFTPKRIAAHEDAIYLDTKLFKRVETLYEKRESLKLDAESARLLEFYYLRFVHRGAKLSDADKAKLNSMSDAR